MLRGLLLAVLALAQRGQASTISNPLKAGGDVTKVLPDYYDHKTTKAYHNATPARGAVPVASVEFGRAGEGEGGGSCAVKFRLRWAAEIESAVLATPVIFPSGPDGKNEIYINTFYQYIEILGYDGYKPFGWPISFEESSFHGSPMLYDIDGDGKYDIGMVDSNANMFWVRVGQFGQYLADFHVQVPRLKVKRNWHEGLAEDFVDSYVALSMFDHEDGSGEAKKDAPKAKLDKLSSSGGGGKQASYPGLSSRGRRLMAEADGAPPPPSPRASSSRRLQEEGGESQGEADEGGGVPGRLEGGLAQQQQQQRGKDKDGDDAVPTEENAEELAEGAFQEGEEGGEEGGDTFEDDYIRRYRDHPSPFGDGSEGGGAGYYDDFRGRSPPPGSEGGEDGAGEEGEGMAYSNEYSAHRHRHYMDDMFAHSYYQGGGGEGMGGMFNDSNFVFVDPHVLSSPLLTDVNGDGQMEVIMTISYYFDAEKYRGVDLGFDPENYVAGGIASWNLEHQVWNWLVHLDLTTDKSRLKALVYSTPTVADLDGDGRSEIVFGTSLGLLYVIDGESGFVRRYFPMQFHEIQSQVAVADVVGDLSLEIIFGDMGGNVVCLSADGDVLWDNKVSGIVTQTPTIGDVDGDGDLDVVVTATYYTHDSMYRAHGGGRGGSEEGPARAERGCHIWAFDGATGEVLPLYPMALPVGSIAIAPVVLVDLHDYSASGAKGGERLLEKDVADLLKLAREDAEVMTEAQRQQASDKTDLAEGAGAGAAEGAAPKKKKSSKKSRRAARLRSVSDPAVPPWVSASAGHEAPPSPSLQTTSLLLGGGKGGSGEGNMRGGGKRGKDSEPDEETILETISKVLSTHKHNGEEAADVESNSTAGMRKASPLAKLAEAGRREKEAELMQHIRYRADSGALGLHLIVAAGDGHIYIIDGANGCAERIDIGEHVYSMPLVDDLSQDGFLDIVVGTVNGQVLALETEIPYHPLNVWSSFPKHRGNGFTHGVSGISVPAHEKRLLRYADTFRRHEGGPAASDEGAEVESDASGNWLPITFDIWDARGALFDPKVEKYYDVTFSSGLNRKSHLLKKRFSSPGRYTVLLPVQPPDSFLLMLGMTNEHGQYFEDSVTISLCTQFYVWIKYIVCAPILIFSISLLFMKSSTSASSN
jgi:hypothetical protein